MNEEERLYEELNTLPKGYISTKRINGREYHYLQYEENGRLKSEYVRNSEFDDLSFGLKRRKEIEGMLKTAHSEGRNMHRPTKRSRELTGSLMMGDIEVARFEKGACIFRNEKLSPLYIKRTGNINKYLASRSIDRSRTNSRLLKKVLGIREDDDCMIALHSYGASITDNYWFKTCGSKLKYDDISFTKDFYADIALKGEILYYPKEAKYSPQLTLTGSYEKCWRRIGNKWWLYKKGTDREIFSELFCSKLAEALKIPTARYEYDDGYIRTENFAFKYNFEPMISLADDDDNYETVFSELYKLSPDFAKQYLLLVWFDALVNNVDRHNENCGLMRSKKTGKIVSLAPNFDNNLALISRSEVLNMDPSKDGLIKCLAKFVKKTPQVAECVRDMEYPKLTKEMIDKILRQMPMKFEKYDIQEYIFRRYEYLKWLQ